MGTPNSQSDELPLEREFQREVNDARELLDFLITGQVALDSLEKKEPVPERLITAVKQAENAIVQGGYPPQEARIAFETAYRDLALLAAPVTVKSLHDTSDSPQYAVTSILTLWKPRPAAILWSRELWMITVGFLSVIVFHEILTRLLTVHYPLDEESEESFVGGLYLLSSILGTLNQYCYGGLGACTYLLRSCHVYIYRREFNRDRLPEYLNRILLGVVGGGAILLFINEVTTDEGRITIGEATLAFLAGYSSDFLFRTIERVIDAILPKVGLNSLPRTRPQVIVDPLSLIDLLDRLQQAKTPEEQKLLQELIAKVQQRI